MAKVHELVEAELENIERVAAELRVKNAPFEKLARKNYF